MAKEGGIRPVSILFSRLQVVTGLSNFFPQTDILFVGTFRREFSEDMSVGRFTLNNKQKVNQTRFYFHTKNRCRCTVKSRLYVHAGTQKFGRRTERDVQVKIIVRLTPCKVFWMRLYQLDAQTSGTYN